jgi:hypothetical protein
MDDDGQPTCGKGLAANAALPAKLAELTAATADVLEQHMKALDARDPNARRELEAYTSLARAHRGIAGDLASVAQQMAGYRDLPMSPHDMTVMTDPHGQAAAFQRLISVERDLLEFLRTKVEQDEALLHQAG